MCSVKESVVELLQKDFDRVLKISRYAERNGVRCEVQLKMKALELFFVTPRQAEDIVKMALARISYKQSQKTLKAYLREGLIV